MKSKNPLTSAPIPKLIRQIGVPVTIGVLFNNLFQIVDTFYAGTISKEALAALALSFPIFFIIIGLGSGLATGTSALIGNALGAEEHDDGLHFAGQGLMLTVILGIIVSIVGIAISPTLFIILGATDATLAMNMSYITPIFIAAVCFNLVFMFNATLSSQGNTKPFRNFLILGFLLNLILNPWFIYGGFGVPAMGIAGVGVATALVQFIGMIYLCIISLRSNLMQGFDLHLLIPNQRKIIEIVQQGLPPALDLSTVSVGSFIVTYFVSQFGTDAVAAYGIAFRLDSIIWIPLVGLDVATITLISQNNGARLYDRMWSAFNTALGYGMIMMVVSGVIVFVLAEPLMRIFTDELELIAIGIVYIRISAVGLLAKPLGFVGLAALRGVKRPILPMVISITRMIVIPAIVLHVLINMLGTNLESIWWTIVWINVGSGLFAWYVVYKLMPRPKAKLAPQP